jgi:hypothetical protein
MLQSSILAMDLPDNKVREQLRLHSQVDPMVGELQAPCALLLDLQLAQAVFEPMEYLQFQD